MHEPPVIWDLHVVLVSSHWSAEMYRDRQKWSSLSSRSGLVSPPWQKIFTGWPGQHSRRAGLCVWPRQQVTWVVQGWTGWPYQPQPLTEWCQSSWQIWDTIAIQAINTVTLPWDPHLSHHTALHCLAYQGSHTKTWVSPGVGEFEDLAFKPPY